MANPIVERSSLSEGFLMTSRLSVFLAIFIALHYYDAETNAKRATGATGRGPAVGLESRSS
jgi:hypothetical protein